jgi:ribonuclease J
MIEVYTIGGFLEIGRNMTLIKYKDEAVVVDMGLHMPNYISFTEDEDIENIDYKQLLEAGAIPDFRYVKKIAHQVKAIIPTHAHLDHLGAIPYIANFFPNAKILGTRFSCEVLKRICKEEGIKLHASPQSIKTGSLHKISKNINIRFVTMTHSTPQTVMVIIETPEGKVAYANDFKFDKTPQLGRKPNKKAISRIGPVKLLIMDTLYSTTLGKTPSEKVAKDMLRDILFDDSIKKDNAVILTTFSSHIARAKTISDFAKRMKRKAVFFGRSFKKYLGAAATSDVYTLPKEYKIVSFSNEVERWLKKVRKNPERYLAVVTGHQAEKKAVLSRMNNGLFDFKKGDVVIFSCIVIPGGDNEVRRASLESSLAHKGVRIFSDIHVSGHASREDHRMLINLLKPEVVIPAHSDKENAEAFLDFVEEEGLANPILAKEGDKILI